MFCNQQFRSLLHLCDINENRSCNNINIAICISSGVLEGVSHKLYMGEQHYEEYINI